MADDLSSSSSFDPMSDSLSLPEMAATGSPDSLTETTSVSWLDKLMEAIVGVLVGLVLLLVACAVLFWNEGRAVRTAKSLAEGAGLVVDADATRVDPGNEGRLVHVQGNLTAGAPLADTSLGIEARAARLVRHVEMYQWKEDSRTETHKRVGGGEDRTTTYTYTRVWADHRNASDRFHVRDGHENPPLRFAGTEIAARDARVGAFQAGPKVVSQLSADRPFPVPAGTAERLSGRPGNGPVQAVGDGLYFGADANNPRIGDVRVTYTIAPLEAVSIVGRQSGDGFAEYQTRAGDRLLMAQPGQVAASDMFAGAEADNRLLTWIIRIVSVVVLWIAFFLVLRPIAVVGDVIPVIGSALSVGAGLASLVATLIVAPLVFAVAWLFFRPVLGIGLIVAALALAAGMHWLSARRRLARPAVPPAVAGPAPLAT